MTTEEGLCVERDLDVRWVWNRFPDQQETRRAVAVTGDAGQVRRLVVGGDEAARTPDHLRQRR